MACHQFGNPIELLALYNLGDFLGGWGMLAALVEGMPAWRNYGSGGTWRVIWGERREARSACVGDHSHVGCVVVDCEVERFRPF